jgi:hypothetical protein
MVDTMLSVNLLMQSPGPTRVQHALDEQLVDHGDEDDIPDG